MVWVVTIAHLVQTSRSRPSANLRVPVLVRHAPTSHCSVYWDCRVPLPCDYSIPYLNLIVNTQLRRITSNRRCRACSSAYTYGARTRSTSAAWLTSQRTVSSFSSILKSMRMGKGRAWSSSITFESVSTVMGRVRLYIAVIPFVWYTLLYHINGRQSTAGLDVRRLTEHLFTSKSVPHWL